MMGFLLWYAWLNSYVAINKIHFAIAITRVMFN